MIYILTGGPATGKGTRSDILARYLEIPHISTGEILRNVSKTDAKMAEMLSRGMLISDEIITKLVKARISMEDCKDGFVLDGYPRTLPQVYLLNEVLKDLGRKIDKVVELVVPDELVYRRILERKQCKNCSKMYGIDFPPKVENVCDDCGGELIVRTDDTKETLKNRIDTYKANAKDILDYYRDEGLLKTVDASSHPESVVEDIKD
ncbi:MAG: nucleoside monophosphate kinase [Clostridia bacterium]